jgi:hypothetical protein
LLLTERLLGQPHPRLGLVFPSAESSFNERLHFSLEFAGLLVSAVGSVLFVAANLPPLWFMALTLIAVTAVVYWLLAWLALKYWRVRLNDAIGLLRADPRNALVQGNWIACGFAHRGAGSFDIRSSATIGRQAVGGPLARCQQALLGTRMSSERSSCCASSMA